MIKNFFIITVFLFLTISCDSGDKNSNADIQSITNTSEKTFKVSILSEADSKAFLSIIGARSVDECLDRAFDVSSTELDKLNCISTIVTHNLHKIDDPEEHYDKTIFRLERTYEYLLVKSRRMQQVKKFESAVVLIHEALVLDEVITQFFHDHAIANHYVIRRKLLLKAIVVVSQASPEIAQGVANLNSWKKHVSRNHNDEFLSYLHVKIALVDSSKSSVKSDLQAKKKSAMKQIREKIYEEQGRKSDFTFEDFEWMSNSQNNHIMTIAFGLKAIGQDNLSTESDSLVNVQPDSGGVALNAPTHICRNVDDDQEVGQSGYEQWDIDHIPSLGDNDLKELKIYAYAGEIDAYLTLQIISGGHKINNVLWKDGEKKIRQDVMSWPVPAGESISFTFYVEGYQNSDQFEDVKFKAILSSHGGFGSDGKRYESYVRTALDESTVYEIDLDIDSNNTDGFVGAGYNDNEDKIENSHNNYVRGRVFPFAYSSDKDYDGVPDFADGFGIAGGLTNGVKLVPIRVNVSDAVDRSSARIKFTYEMNRPVIGQGVGQNQDGSFYVTEGGLRIWNKTSGDRVSGANYPEGNIFASGVEYDLEDLPEDNTLYVEYVDTSIYQARGKKFIKIELIDRGFVCEDLVKVSLVPYIVAYADPTRWDTLMPQKQVYLNDQSVRIRAKFWGEIINEQIAKNCEIPGFNLTTRIFRSNLGEILIPLSDSHVMFENDGVDSDIKLEIDFEELKQLSLLPSSPTQGGSVGYSVMDGADGGLGNFYDSQTFIDGMESRIWWIGGLGGYSNNKNENIPGSNVSLYSIPPQSDLDITFMQSAGVDFLDFRHNGITEPSMIMSQAKWFYFSGHGDSGDYQSGPLFEPSDKSIVSASDLKPYWNDRIDVVIIAGCSTVNVNNLTAGFNNYSPPLLGPGAFYYPGIFLNGIGAKYYLGYAGSAPSDSGGSVQIVDKFTQNYNNINGDPVGAWMISNEEHSAWFASAINANHYYAYFEKQEFFGFPVSYNLKYLAYEDW